MTFRQYLRCAALTVAVGYTVARPESAIAQEISCALLRSSGDQFAGYCRAAADTISQLEITRAPARADIWRGKNRFRNGNLTIIAIDTAQRVYRDFRGWVRVSRLEHSPDSLAFSYDPGATVEPNDDDLRILQRLRDYFSDPAQWSHDPDGDVAAVATQFFQNPSLSTAGYCPDKPRQTLFCALYQTSIVVTGEFWWGRPAMNAIRAAIFADKPELRHPLMLFNGDSATTIIDVQRVIQMAIGFVQERRSCSIQGWVWGKPQAKSCN